MDKRTDAKFVAYVFSAWARSFLARTWTVLTLKRTLPSYTLKMLSVLRFALDIPIALGIIIIGRHINAAFTGPGMLLAFIFLAWEYRTMKRVLGYRYLASIIGFVAVIAITSPLVRSAVVKYWPFFVGEAALICMAYFALPWLSVARLRLSSSYGAVVAAEILFRLLVKLRGQFDSLYRLWGKFRLGTMSLAFVHYCALCYVAFATFVTATNMECVDQPGVSRFQTVCELSRRQHLISTPQAIWQDALYELKGVPEKISFTGRDFYCDGSEDCATINANFGWFDAWDHPSVIIKWDRRTKEVINIQPAYSPLSGQCFANAKQCLVSSPMTNSILVTHSETGELIKVLDFKDFTPSYFTESSYPDMVYLVLQRGGKLAQDTTRSVPVQTVSEESSCRPEGRFVLARYNVMTGSIHCDPLRGSYFAGALGGPDTHFAHYDPITKSIFIGGKLGRIDLQALTIENVHMPLWLQFWSGGEAGGAASDVENGLVYVNLPFAGVAIFNERLKYLRLIPQRDGGRPLVYHHQEGLLYSGNYDDGLVRVIDPRSGAIVERFIAGNCLRNLHIEQSRQVLLTASASGFTEINLVKAPHAEQPRLVTASLQ